AFGAGLGLSSVSPWSGSGVSATTFKVGTGIYLLIVAVMSSAVGGYLAARLRTRWVGLDTSEVFFRDTAHGLIAWAFATLLSAGVLGAATTHLVSGGLTGAATAAAANANPAALYVDELLRPNPAAPPATAAPAPGGFDPTRAELSRLWTAAVRDGNDLGAADRTYVAQVVAARTGLSQPEAERRVTDVINQAKATADK